ncbi:lamin tail domain-containing protein [Candidatus Woesearchaeota archaeon]|nr:lamin tail domain-containing protein [Candidatus Woesearchaeota archaeon]
MGTFANAVYINEFLADGLIEPDSEWVEIFNDMPSELNLADFNITEEQASSNFTLNATIPANGFIVLVENFTLFNLTYPKINASGIKIIEYGQIIASFQLSNSAGNITLYNSSGSKIDNISYSSTNKNISIGRFPDGASNIISFAIQTPGTINENSAPVLNKWIMPSANNTLASGKLNITANITDAASAVNMSLVNFNGTNFSMEKSEDVWFFVWNISKNMEKTVNITIYFNDSNGFSSSNSIFNITAGNAPDFNKWALKNNSFVNILFNITANITDISGVSKAFVNFNNTNFSMSQYNDLWYYLWNTTLNLEKSYNITLYFNDTFSFFGYDFLFNITVDNTKPKISNANITANARNFISPGFIFNVSLNATDANLANLTCSLNNLTSNITASNFSVNGDIHKCSFTAPFFEGDFTIALSAMDKAGNINATSINFTTKYATLASLMPLSAVISNLNQSDKEINVTAFLSNIGNTPLYDAGIFIDSFSSNAILTMQPLYKPCGFVINSSQSCALNFTVIIRGATSEGTHKIFWNANWTDNNFTKKDFSQAVQSSVNIQKNPKLTAAENISAAIKHGENINLTLHINSTGNSALEDVNISFIQNTLESSWVRIFPARFASIASSLNATSGINITIPKGTNPGTYIGTLSIAASGIPAKAVLLTINVPEDSSWIIFPNATITYAKSTAAGIAGNFTINNTGNVGHNFSFSPITGSLFFYLWNNSNIRGAYVERNQTGAVSIYHLQMNGNAPDSINSFSLEITVRSQNTSQANATSITLVRDDNFPFVNITNPINNSFVKGIAGFKVNANDSNLSRIDFFIGNSLALSTSEINFSLNWSTLNSLYPDNVYTLRAVAFDTAGNFNTSEINVTVNNTDDNPVFVGNIPQISITEDNDSTILNLSLYFKTLDGDSLKYNFTKAENITIHVNNATQAANFTPNINFFGINYVIFTAIDSSFNATKSNNITINVANINDAPAIPILLNPANNSIIRSATGNILLEWSSFDADNELITYFIFFSNSSENISSNALPVNATTTLNKIAFTDLRNGTYFWKVTASDGTKNSTISDIFQFSLNLNTKPNIAYWQWNNTIEASASNTTANKNPAMMENKTLSFNVTAIDADNDKVNYTWLLNNTEKSSIQNFTFNFTENFTSAGFYNITLIVQDNNSNSASESWNLTITNTNRMPLAVQIPNQSIVEEASLKINLSQFFLEADTDDILTFFVVFQNTSQVSCIVQEQNLTLIGGKDFAGNGSNAARCSIAASDGASNSTNNTFFINASNTNDAPLIISFFPPDNATIAENGRQILNVTFSDADAGDVLTASWLKNGTLINANSANISIDGLSKGIYNITVIAADSANAIARYEWKLLVTTDINATELFSPILNLNETQRQNATNVTINQTAFGGIDFENNTLNFSGIAKLEDAFNVSRNMISVDTDKFRALNKSASVILKSLNFTKAPLIFAASGFKNTDNAAICPESLCMNKSYDAANKILRFKAAHFTTFFAQKNATNGAPEITSMPITKANIVETYSYNVKAIDADGDALIFSLAISPSGMSISSSGLITWNPGASQLGKNNVTVSVSDSNLTSNQSFQILVDAGPRLIISDVDVIIDGKSSKNQRNDTKIRKKVKPGSEVEFDVELKNLFTKEERLGIEDVTLDASILDIDDGDDLEKETDEFDIGAKKNEKSKLKFNIPIEADEGTFDVIINAEGSDENGTFHNAIFKLELDVEKEKHEIKIIRNEIMPLTIKCQRQISINTEIANTGLEDEGNAALQIISNELGINSMFSGIKLEEGTRNNRFTKIAAYTIDKNVLAGNYQINVNSYYDDKLSDTKTIELSVEECEKAKQMQKEVQKEAIEEKPKAEEKPKIEVIKQPIAAKQPIKQAKETSKKEKQKEKKEDTKISFIETEEYKVILIISLIILTGTAIFIIGAGFIVLGK